MFRCKIYAAELAKSHNAIRAKKLWLEEAITAEHMLTGYVPRPGFILSSGYKVQEIRSTDSCILLIINRKENE